MYSYSLGYTLYDNQTFNVSTPTSFSELAAHIDLLRSDRKGEAFICAPMLSESTGANRNKESAQPRAWLPFDVDRCTPAVFRRVLKQMEKYNSVVYTTARHTAEAPRFRFIMDAGKALSRTDGIRVCLALESRMKKDFGEDIEFDPTVYRGEQPVFTPLYTSEVYVNAGRTVATQRLLESAPSLQENAGSQERASEEGKRDRVFQALLQKELVLKGMAPGKYAIRCPFESEHSISSAESSTVYWLPSFGGYKYGRFNCFHSHCLERAQDDFQRALGLDPDTLWRKAKSSRTAHVAPPQVESLMRLYREGLPQGLTTGWSAVDELYRPRPGDFTVITGAPGSGKSTWMGALAVNMAKQHGWKIAVYSPEMSPTAHHQATLLECLVGKPFTKGPTPRMTEEEMLSGLDVLNRHFFWIEPDEDESPDVSAVLGQARELVETQGIQGLILDPWNEFHHPLNGKLNETQYAHEATRDIRMFARRNGVHVWLVAHPTKLRKLESGEYPTPTPYDINGSAAFYNRADVCLSLKRMESGDMVELHVQKVRFRQIGRLGSTVLALDIVTGRYFSTGVSEESQEARNGRREYQTSGRKNKPSTEPHRASEEEDTPYL